MGRSIYSYLVLFFTLFFLGEVKADDLVLDYSPDFNKPEIGALTAIDCGFTIAITDNIQI